MRRLILILPILLPMVAHAQVATDDHALDALTPPPPKPAATKPGATQPNPTKPGDTKHVPPKAGSAKPKPAPSSAHPAKGKSATAHPKAPPRPTRPGNVTMPVVPPANPVLAPPPFVMPAHKPPPPPPVPVRADAPGAATDITGGTRVTFGPGVSDLNPATLAAAKAIATRASADPALIITITAWAPGTADDPSTPRRLSLDRALAVRAVLINAGVVSERIRAVAKGMSDFGNGPTDRADIVLLPAGK